MIKITKRGNKAWVTFAIAPSEELASVAVAGEWGDWNSEPMKQKKNGEYFITKVLKTGNSYQFGYRFNGESWQKEDDLPAVASPFGSENSLLEL